MPNRRDFSSVSCSPLPLLAVIGRLNLEVEALVVVVVTGMMGTKAEEGGERIRAPTTAASRRCLVISFVVCVVMLLVLLVFTFSFFYDLWLPLSLHNRAFLLPQDTEQRTDGICPSQHALIWAQRVR